MTMDLTPIDLRKQEFRRVWRGCDPAEVRRVLDAAADAWEGLIRSREEIRSRTAELEETIESYRRMERTLNETLLAAQRLAEESREAAAREAELLRKEAEMDARRLVEGAESEVRALEERIRQLRAEREGLFLRVRGLLEDELMRLQALHELRVDSAPVHMEPGDGVLEPPAAVRDRLDRPRELRSAPSGAGGAP
jgi:cell division initiation protein